MDNWGNNLNKFNCNNNSNIPTQNQGRFNNPQIQNVPLSFASFFVFNEFLPYCFIVLSTINYNEQLLSTQLPFSFIE